MRLFGRILVALYPTGNGSGDKLSLAEIRIQKEGPVNLQRLVRDFLTTLGESWPTHHQSRRPSSCVLIAAKDASILAHFSQSEIGIGMDPKTGYT